MLESMTEWMGYPMYYAFEGAAPPPRAGAAHATIYPYGPFEAGDGRSVMLGLQNEREWASFCTTVLQQPTLASDERFKANALRVANRDELRALILQAFRDLSAEQVIERLEQAQIANANVNGMPDVWEHPQLKARERWTAVDTSAGPIPALLPPASNTDFSPRMDRVPALGEHSSAILSQLGYAPDAIEQLQQSGII
jgi:itaconate CoA-transferase